MNELLKHWSILNIQFKSFLDMYFGVQFTKSSAAANALQ